MKLEGAWVTCYFTSWPKESTLFALQHFSNAGFPCPIMQSPSDHFLRAINTDFDRIIAMCKNLQVTLLSSAFRSPEMAYIHYLFVFQHHVIACEHY